MSADMDPAKEFLAARAKLEACFSRLGAVTIEGTELMGISTSFKGPSFD
jgi:hypothetical protein